MQHIFTKQQKILIRLLEIFYSYSYCSRPGHSGGTTVAYSLWTNRVSIRVANPTKNLKWFSGIFSGRFKNMD